MRQEIAAIINRAIKETQKQGDLPRFAIGEILVERPEDPSHGDYATNIPLQIAKIAKRNPVEIAANLKSQILSRKSDLFERVEVAGPGFINFFLSKEYLQKQVGEILKEREKFGQLNIGRDKKVNIEFISANPTGPLHIGNGRNAFAGDVLANVLELAGYRVTREYYINDAKNSNQIIELGKTTLGRGKTYLTANLKSQISRLRQRYNKFSKLTESEVGCKLAQIVQRDIKNFLEKKTKIRIDTWVSEEDLYSKNKITKVFKWLKREKLVYKKDGAWWIKTSKFGDEKDWVVIRENGQPTYLLSDIAYHKDKFKRGFKRVIDIWGADHQAHVSKIKAVSKMLGHKGDVDVLVLQLVTLRGGERLSKRRGEIITLEELVDEIGLDAARFFYLQRSLNTHMELDLSLAKERSQKNPVYYVQYAHARICSILRKAGEKSFKFQVSSFKKLNHPSELALIKQLVRLPEVVEDTAKDHQLQRLPQYAVDVAASFHQFYRDCKVIGRDKKQQEARLALVLAAKVVLKNALSLMGISAPEKM